MSISKPTIVGFIGTILLLFTVSGNVGAQDAAGLSLVERSGEWDSYLMQKADYNSAVYEVALPSKNAQTPYSLVIGRPYANCDSPTVTYYLAPAVEEEINHGNLKGSLKVGEQTFDVTYGLESTGTGVFTIRLTRFDQAMIAAMRDSPSAEISFPDLDNFTTTASLAGFAAAWERAGVLCGNGQGIKLF